MSRFYVGVLIWEESNCEVLHTRKLISVYIQNLISVHLCMASHL